jgi:hypothetical protein
MTSLIIAAIVSMIVLAVVVYFSLRIDWAKVIGRWFPWALKNGNEEEDDHNDNNEGNDHHHTKESSR